MDDILYPLSHETFRLWVLPIIEKSYIWKGRPPKISHYKVFCAILYIIKTQTSWRKLPKSFGNWHHIYMRFHRGNQRGLWWKILFTLQREQKLHMNIFIHGFNTQSYYTELYQPGYQIRSL